jgi:hypothetical protein
MWQVYLDDLSRWERVALGAPADQKLALGSDLVLTLRLPRPGGHVPDYGRVYASVIRP